MAGSRGCTLQFGTNLIMSSYIGVVLQFQEYQFQEYRLLVHALMGQ